MAGPVGVDASDVIRNRGEFVFEFRLEWLCSIFVCDLEDRDDFGAPSSLAIGENSGTTKGASPLSGERSLWGACFSIDA